MSTEYWIITCLSFFCVWLLAANIYLRATFKKGNHNEKECKLIVAELQLTIQELTNQRVNK